VARFINIAGEADQAEVAITDAGHHRPDAASI
jgi:hypothetical protein